MKPPILLLCYPDFILKFQEVMDIAPGEGLGNAPALKAQTPANKQKMTGVSVNLRWYIFHTGTSVKIMQYFRDKVKNQFAIWHHKERSFL